MMIVCFQVFFLPMSNTIMMCFKDDSIFAWDSETMQSLYHLHVPTPGEKSLGFKAFAVSKYVLYCALTRYQIYICHIEPFVSLLWGQLCTSLGSSLRYLTKMGRVGRS